MGNKKTEARKRARDRKRAEKRNMSIGKGKAPVPPAVNNRQRGQAGLRTPRITTNGAETLLEYEELWPLMGQGVTNYSFTPGSSGLVKLDQFARGWDQYKLERADVRYATSSGTTTAGHVYVGIDYSALTVAQSVTDVTSLDPRDDGPVWENLIVKVNPRLAMSKPIMSTGSSDPDNTAFVASVYSDVAGAGVIWCNYRVRFTSPKQNAVTDVGILAAASATTTNNAVVIPVGVPSITTTPDVSAVTTGISMAKTTMETKFDYNEPVAAGKQFAISSLATNSSANGTLTVQFLDAATGAPLPSTVVRPVAIGSRVGSIWTAIWGFVRPWVKPFIISAVDTLLVTGANNESNSHETYHLLSDRPPVSFAVAEDPSAKTGDIVSLGGVYTGGAWVTWRNPGYDISLAQESSPNGFTVFKRNATTLPVGTVIAINAKLSATTGSPTATFGDPVAVQPGVTVKSRQSDLTERIFYLQVTEPLDYNTALDLVRLPIAVGAANNDAVSVGACVISQSAASTGAGSLASFVPLH